MEKSIVAVIEIGDIYTRCAISSTADFNENPTKTLFLAFQSPLHYPTHQLPTSILLNEKQEFEAYGYDAEIKYRKLHKNGTHHNSFYFKQFRLQFGKSNRNSTVKTYNGKNEISFVFLMSLIVRYLKSQVLSCISKYTNLTDDEIQWILPIPNEWVGFYEGIFIQACFDGGLRHENFCTIVESKAEYTFKKYSSSGSSAGEKILVVDCGVRNLFPDHNFTANFSDDAPFENIGVWDCTPIDRILRNIFIEITGKDIVHDDRIPREERIDLYRTIQYKIEKNKCSFKIPLVWRDEIDARLCNTSYSENVRLIGDKLKFSDTFVFDMVQNALQPFLHKVLSCIEDYNIYDTVGQYSGVSLITSVIDKMLQNTKDDHFFKERSEDVGSICKGAAILGHVPTLVRFSEFRFNLHMKNLETSIMTEKDPRLESTDKETVNIKLKENALISTIWVPNRTDGYQFKTPSWYDSNGDHLISDAVLHEEVFLITNPEKQILQTKQSDIVDNMCSLYDNEWANYLGVLLEKELSEERSIEILLDILVQSYGECRRYIRQQTTEIAKLFCPSSTEQELQCIIKGESRKVSHDLLSSITSWRQTCKKQYMKEVWKNISKTLNTTFNRNSIDIDDFHYYIEENISICWDMLCEEPPMCMNWKFRKDSEIDKSLLKLYTKNGQYVNFIVWPVIYSHESGKVLKEGVVQAK